MTSLARETVDERDTLLLFLEESRAELRQTVKDLSTEQAALDPSASTLSLGGLIKHVALCERNWISVILAGRPDTSGIAENWEDGFRFVGGETLADVLKLYEDVAAETAEIVRALPDLDVTALLPKAPWFPPNGKRSARWILLHMITETTRHTGHADVVRETLDGKTSLELSFTPEERAAFAEQMAAQ